MARHSWLEVDIDGLKKILEHRGKGLAVNELIQNAWDENITKVEVTLARPVNGRSVLTVTDDSPTGFADLTDTYRMFSESYKKDKPEKRGRFNLGEKYVLALCDEASISSTTGTVFFDGHGRHRSPKKTAAGSIFEGRLRLTLKEYDEVCVSVRKLLPPVPTFFNGEEISPRKAEKTWKIELPTVTADAEGNLRGSRRITNIATYEVKEGETATIYEMGIPVVTFNCKYHVNIFQKVPLNVDRDNVTPAYLKTLQVEILNQTFYDLSAEEAKAIWVSAGHDDARCSSEANEAVLTARYGENRVAFDPTDIGANREAASAGYVVVHGGSMSAGQWANARRDCALVPAGKSQFSTNLSSKIPDKSYSRAEWSEEMKAYADFVEKVSPDLVGYKVTVEFIEDVAMVHGQFFGEKFVCNLAHHKVSDWQQNIELMLHELSHVVVKSNDHLCREFYETVTQLGAKLTILISEKPGLLKFAVFQV